jgi:hypothetical protein
MHRDLERSKRQLARSKESGSAFLKDASLAVVVCGDTDNKYKSTQNLVRQIH